ncbi:ADP-ribosyltransferase [Streptomyces sp. NBC_00237]|uniref:ADP-ribosyltransferase n=1 Tax=Streptomyces sp. NBC_00237 TaxID=2975687 RepID=UPI002B1E6485|nr:ADP-ribosyltransferase [Streptomyces sp. NBC_00237]
MITTHPRRRTAFLPSAALALTALLAAPSAAAAPAPAPAAATYRVAAPPACPQVYDPMAAAVDKTVEFGRITPKPFVRKTCGTLYRVDGRGPDVVFVEGFRPKEAVNGQYDVEKYVLKNQPSPFVSTTYDHDLFKQWVKWMKGGAFNYYIDAPGGIDVNKTIGDTHKYADQVEVAFPGGIRAEFVVGVCPVDKETRTEIMSACKSNPKYRAPEAV